MACSQKVRDSTKAQSKCSLFPTNLKSRTSSFVFAKSLIGASISSICYLRNIFPNSDFAERKWDGEDLKILKGNSPDAHNFVKNLRGIFDALEKTYLREIKFGVYTDPNKPDDVLETYVFNVQYGTDGAPSVTLNGAEEKEATEKIYRNVKRFLRKMFFMVSHLDSLPTDKLYVGIKLLYYDERTPADYQPPGFQSAMNPDYFFPKEKNPCAVSFGKIETNHHIIKANCTSIFLDKTEAETEEISSVQSVTEAQTNKLPPMPIAVLPPPLAKENFAGKGSFSAQNESVNDENLFKKPSFTSHMRKSTAPLKTITPIAAQLQTPKTSSPGFGILKNTFSDVGQLSPISSPFRDRSSQRCSTTCDENSQQFSACDKNSQYSSASDENSQRSSTCDENSQRSSTCDENSSQRSSMFDENSQRDADCVCGIKQWDRLMFRCGACRNVQHAICYGYLIAPTTNVNGYVCGFCARNESVNGKICFDPNFVKSDPLTFKTVAFSRRVIAILLSWPGQTICLKDVLNLLPVNSEDVAAIGRLFDRFMAYGFIAKSPFLKVTHRKIVHKRIYERLCQFFCNGYEEYERQLEASAASDQNSTSSSMESCENVKNGKRNVKKNPSDTANKRKKTIYDSGPLHRIDI